MEKKKVAQKEVWIPVRTVYNKEMAVAEFLKREGIVYYIPMQYELVDVDGKEGACERKLVPAIHNLVFMKHVYDREWCRELAARADVPLIFLKRERNGMEFCTIGEQEMENFMNAMNPEVEGTRFIDPENLKGKKWVPVRVVRKGPLYGVTGRFVRYGGKHYIAIEVANSTALMKVSLTWCEVIEEQVAERE